MWANITCNSLSSNVESEKLKVLIHAIAKSLRESDQASPEWASYGDVGFYLNTGSTIDECPWWPNEEQAYEGFDPSQIETILKIVLEQNDAGDYFFVTLARILDALGWLPDERPCGSVEWGYEDGPGEGKPFPYLDSPFSP